MVEAGKQHLKKKKKSNKIKKVKTFLHIDTNHIIIWYLVSLTLNIQLLQYLTDFYLLGAMLKQSSAIHWE